MIPIHSIRVAPCCIRFPVPCDNQIVGRARVTGRIRHCEGRVLSWDEPGGQISCSPRPPRNGKIRGSPVTDEKEQQVAAAAARWPSRKRHPQDHVVGREVHALGPRRLNAVAAHHDLPRPAQDP